MKFLDSIAIKVKAGKGGDGVVSFKSARGAAKLGADGGDGGIGGNVVLVGNGQLNTLIALRYGDRYHAEDGVRGGPNGCRGRGGEDLEIPVPLGTMIFHPETNELIGELLEDGQRLIIAKGGNRGLGNIHWLSSTHQQPQEYKPGQKGEELEIRLDLKLIADVGLAGFPNAGKSTLLSVISAARPKIADYPFTTLVPNLGVVGLGADFYGQSIVVADVPGLIEGASDGRGLGLQFLRHLERTSLIAYVLDAFGLEQDPLEALDILRVEMERFSPELAAKRCIVLVTKIDLVDDERKQELVDTLTARGFEVLALSAAANMGIRELKHRLHALVTEVKIQQKEAEAPSLSEARPTVRFASDHAPHLRGLDLGDGFGVEQV